MPSSPLWDGLFQRQYIRPETMGGLGTPTFAALAQMFDPMGLSPAQLDRNDAMRSPLLQAGLQRNGVMGQPGGLLSGTFSDQGNQIAERNSLAEDLNSVMLKLGNWRKSQFGDLTPQDRVTQGFMDVRNPNSYY